MGPPVEKKTEKTSYFPSAINPWGGSRSTTPTPKDQPLPPPPPPPPSSSSNPLSQTNRGDHSISSIYGHSLKNYPPDCPPLNVQWFHAVDVPKRKPEWLKSKKPPKDPKPTPPPKKYAAFSDEDNRSLESAYQLLLEEVEGERNTGSIKGSGSVPKRKRTLGAQDAPGGDLGQPSGDQQHVGVRVPVNEDFLFDVDIEERELSPVYWLGPTYDVRRGTWFYQEGSTLRPCEENLAAQLEEGYLKAKPWLYPPTRKRSNSAAREVIPKASSENLKSVAGTQGDAPSKRDSYPGQLQQQQQHQPQTHRLFGTYMNNIATYQDSSTAWLSSEGMLSWVTTTVYERFAGGGYMSGVKLVRGYTEPKKPKDDNKAVPTPTFSKLSAEPDEKEMRALKRRSAPPTTKSDPSDEAFARKDQAATALKVRDSQLQRQLSSLIEGTDSRDPEEEEEQIRKREEKEIQDDYTAPAGESQGREIEHLVLVTHGIGQLLGLRMDSVNFVHDVNVMRKNLKSVYTTSADLKALNGESGDGLGNCRIQVLPVCWRHLLDFPRRREEKRREHDLGETVKEEYDYPSLEDITIEGVAFARSLISDLALDVLLYQSAYREQISEIVCKEANQIYRLFMERNPGFKGKVHVMGHSLGSAIMFDILCRQREKAKSTEQRNPLRFWPSQEKPEPPKDPRDLSFDFDVEDFYCLGSPIGLFQMLKGRTIAARHLPGAVPSESPLNPEMVNDPFLSANFGNLDQRISPITGLPFSISSPKVSQLFNIFHPSDPISYRLEPLISPAMSVLKPQALPYTKKGIFGSVAPQGLTGIGAKVGQSVSGLWSSLSAGIASNLLNRSLGLTHEDVANITASSQHPQSPGAGTNIAGGVISDATALGEKTNARKLQLADATNGEGQANLSGNDATLLDDELETLYSRFQKKRLDLAKETSSKTDIMRDTRAEEEAKSQRLKREEAKVRALNRNGRIDYSIQESALDFNPINTIASHMAYWADEDVSHFVMSQLLSNKARQRRK